MRPSSFRDLMLAGTFFLALHLSSCVYSNRAATRLLQKAGKEPAYDVIVVPGVPLENGKWSRTMKARIYWSKYLFEQGIAKNIMYSGSAVYSPYKEAEVMAMYAAAIGIPAEHIFTETKAEHSTENIFYSYKKAKQLGFKRIALASDRFQTRSLKGFVNKKVSAAIGLIPMVRDTMEEMDIPETDPDINFQPAFVKDFIPITKRESLWERLRGTRGKKIDQNAYE